MRRLRHSEHPNSTGYKGDGASEEGFAVSVPGRPGCWSQGTTEAEALENIKQAIEEYLAVVDGELKGATIREVEVAA